MTTFKNTSPFSECLLFFPPNKWCVWAKAFLKWKLISPTNDKSYSPAKVLLCWGNKYENHSQTHPRCTWDELFAITACPAVHFTHRHHMGAFFPSLSYHSLLLTQSNNCSQHTTNILRTCLRCGPRAACCCCRQGLPAPLVHHKGGLISSSITEHTLSLSLWLTERISQYWNGGEQICICGMSWCIKGADEHSGLQLRLARHTASIRVGLPQPLLDLFITAGFSSVYAASICAALCFKLQSAKKPSKTTLIPRRLLALLYDATCFGRP